MKYTCLRVTFEAWFVPKVIDITELIVSLMSGLHLHRKTVPTLFDTAIFTGFLFLFLTRDIRYWMSDVGWLGSSGDWSDSTVHQTNSFISQSLLQMMLITYISKLKKYFWVNGGSPKNREQLALKVWVDLICRSNLTIRHGWDLLIWWLKIILVSKIKCPISWSKSQS